MSCTSEQAASRFEIGDVVSVLAIALDDLDFARLRGVLAEDVVWVVGRGKPDLVGPDAVVDYLRSLVTPMSITVHRPATPVVAFESDDDASGEVVASVQMAYGDTATVLEIRYQDRYTRRDGAWKLARRMAQTVYALPLADLPALLPQQTRQTAKTSGASQSTDGEST